MESYSKCQCPRLQNQSNNDLGFEFVQYNLTTTAPKLAFQQHGLGETLKVYISFVILRFLYLYEIFGKFGLALRKWKNETQMPDFWRELPSR